VPQGLGPKGDSYWLWLSETGFARLRGELFDSVEKLKVRLEGLRQLNRQYGWEFVREAGGASDDPRESVTRYLWRRPTQRKYVQIQPP
jgi:hypothetical protein